MPNPSNLQGVVMKFVTHSGMYHADDVLSTALLCIVYGKSEVLSKLERVSDITSVEIKEKEGDIVFDIGYGQFDHHQSDKRVRTNGIPYAAFGLLWKKYSTLSGIGLGLHPWVADLMDKEFVQFVDQTDNFGQAKYPNTLAALVSSAFKAGRSFVDTVTLVLPLLEDLIKSYKELSDQKSDFVLEYDDSSIFNGKTRHFDGRVFEGTNVKFVLGPSLRGPGVVLRSLDSDNYPIVDVEGIRPLFIHAGRFTATYASEEDALAAANASL